MKNVNFKQAKYIIPLILLPALFVFNYLAYGYAQKKQNQTVQTITVDSTKLNPNIQDATQANIGISDKFTAVKDQFKQQTDSSVMQNMTQDQIENVSNSINGSKSKLFADSMRHAVLARNAEFQRKMNQTNAAIDRAQNPNRVNSGTVNTSYKKANDAVELQHMLDKLQAQKQEQAYLSGNQYQPTSSISGKRNDYDEFKQQMQYLDSLQQSHNPNNKRNKAETPKQQFVDTVKPLAVEKSSSINLNKFNTVYRNKSENFIQAIVDQSTQSFAGSRVRLRLLDDINVGQEIITKGTYLYAFVTGFAAQRIFLSVTSINRNSTFLPVKLAIYDNDGLNGLYIPLSKFRDFTRELGAGSASTIQYSSQSSSTAMTDQIEQGLISRLFSGTSTAISKMFKENKALIKYSTIVYLIPSKQ